MDIKQSIRSALGSVDFIVRGYLADITPEEMLIRAAPGSNHIAWQFGHCIWAEHRSVAGAAGALMPALPEGFADVYGRGAACSDDPSQFRSKEEYSQLAQEIRAGTLKALDQLSEADLDKPISGRAPPFIKTVGDALSMIAPHWTLHAGQWAMIRRHLGRPPLF